mgnify:CR=1 FL=1
MIAEALAQCSTSISVIANTARSRRGLAASCWIHTFHAAQARNPADWNSFFLSAPEMMYR